MVLTDGEWVASLKITTNPGKMETVAALNLGLSRSGFWSQFGWTLERFIFVVVLSFFGMAII